MKSTGPILDNLAALTDPVRCRILLLLERHELTVGELTSILRMAQSRISGHLAVLRESELVRDRRQGTSAFYSLAAESPDRLFDALTSRFRR